jgi:hypothetical protein
MRDIPSRILEIAEQLGANKQPRRRSVRSLLKWFGAKRRGASVIKEIQDTLHRVGITTDPDLTQVGIDEPLQFLMTSAARPSASSSSEEYSVTQETVSKDSGVESRPDSLANLDLHSEDYLEPEFDEDSALDKADDRPVLSQPCDWNIAVLRDKHERGQLNLQPRYQREYVWELRSELPSRLIESLLLEIPIPPIYFGKMPDGRLEVIDGQQRLTTLINFASNKFRLQRLQQMRRFEASSSMLERTWTSGTRSLRGSIVDQWP